MGLEHIRKIKSEAGEIKPQKKYVIPKVSKKRQKQLAEQKAERIGGGNELDRWFKERRKEMSGECMHCSGKTTKHQDSWYKCSIAHLLPKRFFKSVATHPLNWIELCLWNNNCHQQYDNFILDITDMNCFNTIIERFIAIYPDIDQKERKYIPDVLLQYVKNEHDKI